MGEVQQKDTNRLIKEAIDYYKQILNFYPRRTKLQTLNRLEWQDFCNRFDPDSSSEGIFLPRNLTAYLLKESENLPLNLFHEYFGHGLFYEYSKHGKFMEKLEKRLMGEEKKNFRGRQFSMQELSDFRVENPVFKILEKEINKNFALYETFAIWTEHYLSKLFEMNDRFEQKYKEMPIELRENLEEMLKFQQDYGELVLFYEVGMPKYYNKDKIKELAKQIFKDKLNSADLLVLYGSKKPYSDIDLFIVSSEIKDSVNKWLDIYSLTKEEFEYHVSVFDVAVTDALLTGELIWGDKEYFEKKKSRLMSQPITQEAIYHNLRKSKEQRDLVDKFPKNSKEYSIGISYAETYFNNALALKQGKRKLTKSFLLNQV